MAENQVWAIEMISMIRPAPHQEPRVGQFVWVNGPNGGVGIVPERVSVLTDDELASLDWPSSFKTE